MSSGPIVCKHLRGKGAPGEIYDDAVTWDAGYQSSAVYWCTATADRTGPDDSFVHPHVCAAARVCFVSAQPEPHDDS